MAHRNAESIVRDVIARIDAAWRQKQFDDLADCFHEHAAICGPGYVPYATGSTACANSYREFELNASVLSYSESGHALRMFDHTAVYTFRWTMTYQREQAPEARAWHRSACVLQRKRAMASCISIRIL